LQGTGAGHRCDTFISSSSSSSSSSSGGPSSSSRIRASGVGVSLARDRGWAQVRRSSSSEVQ
jgi:hypothetical protein